MTPADLKNIQTIFNNASLPLKDRVLDILILKIEEPIVFILNEDKNKIVDVKTFESTASFTKFLYEIPTGFGLILIYKENDFYMSGVRLTDESWSHKFDGSKIEIDHYNSDNYPIEVNMTHELIKFTRSLFSKSVDSE